MKAAALCALLALAACSSGSVAPVTISQAIAGVQADLAGHGVVSVSHAEAWTDSQRAAFRSNVWAFQCEQRAADPLVPMIAGPVTMQLSGSFSQSGSFTVSTSVGWPVFGLQADASRTKGQAMNVPVQFVPLSALADAEAARLVGYAGALLAQNDDTRHSEGRRIQNSRDALEHEVQFLVAGYSGGICRGAHLFVGGRRG